MTQLGIYKVKIILRNGQALLGMSDTEIINIITINCNTIGMQETGRAAKCSTNKANNQGSGCEKHCTNARQEASRPGRCYTNTSHNLNLKSNNTDMPVVNKNEINYFLPAPLKIMTRKQVLKSQSNYKQILKMF